MVTARPAAAALWVLGMSSRLIFGIVALHGGAEAIGRLSGKFDLHSTSTWPTALITMALCEVLSRTLVLLHSHHRAANLLAAPAAGAMASPGPRTPGHARSAALRLGHR